MNAQFPSRIYVEGPFKAKISKAEMGTDLDYHFSQNGPLVAIRLRCQLVCFFWRLGENRFPCLFQLQEAAHILWLMSSSIFKIKMDN